MNQSHDTVSQTWRKPFQSPASIPESADVVVIGGGIIGVSTAWFLARQGIGVTLCEKGHIAGEQSGRNWGWIRQMARDTRELPMMIESMRIWESLAAEIGEDVGFQQSGCMILARTEKYLSEMAQWLPVATEHDLDTRLVASDELDTLVADASTHWIGAMLTSNDARAEPHKATPALCRAAKRHGANILTSCAVRGIETSAGQVSAVVTEHGSIKTSSVLCAAGAWSSLFCRSLGISLPQLRVKGTVARLAPCDSVLEGNVYDEKLGIRRRQDGGYTVAHGFLLDHPLTPSTFRYAIKFIPALMQEMGKLRLSIGHEFFDEIRTPSTWPLDQESPFEKQRVLDPTANQRTLKEMRQEINALFPQLANTEIVETWAGMVDTTPDVIPVIGETETIPGFYVATGFSGHGFGIGPGAGKACAGMLTNTDSGIDLSEFQLKRFFDGSKIRPQSSV